MAFYTQQVLGSQFPQYIPQVNFSQLSSLSPQTVEEIRRIGTVVIKDIVDDAEARAWQDHLKDFVKTNPDVSGRCNLHKVQGGGIV